MKRVLATVLLCGVLLSAVFGLMACSSAEALPEIDSSIKSTIKDKPQSGTPADQSARDNIYITAGVLQDAGAFYSQAFGTVNTLVGPQYVYTDRTVVGESLFKQVLCDGAMKGADMYYVANNNYLHRTGKIKNLEKKEADFNNTAKSLSKEAYIGKFGSVTTELSEYVLNDQSIVSATTKKAGSLYEIELVLDTKIAPTYCKYGVMANGGTSKEPKYDYIELVVTIDENWVVQKVVEKSAYELTVAIITSKCSQTIEEVFESLGEVSELPETDFFSQFMNQEVEETEDAFAMDIIEQIISSPIYCNFSVAGESNTSGKLALDARDFSKIGVRAVLETSLLDLNGSGKTEVDLAFTNDTLYLALNSLKLKLSKVALAETDLLNTLLGKEKAGGFSLDDIAVDMDAEKIDDLHFVYITLGIEDFVIKVTLSANLEDGKYIFAGGKIEALGILVNLEACEEFEILPNDAENYFSVDKAIAMAKGLIADTESVQVMLNYKDIVLAPTYYFATNSIYIDLAGNSFSFDINSLSDILSAFGVDGGDLNLDELSLEDIFSAYKSFSLQQDGKIWTAKLVLEIKGKNIEVLLSLKEKNSQYIFIDAKATVGDFAVAIEVGNSEIDFEKYFSLDKTILMAKELLETKSIKVSVDSLLNESLELIYSLENKTAYVGFGDLKVQLGVDTLKTFLKQIGVDLSTDFADIENIDIDLDFDNLQAILSSLKVTKTANGWQICLSYGDISLDLNILANNSYALQNIVLNVSGIEVVATLNESFDAKSYTDVNAFFSAVGNFVEEYDFTNMQVEFSGRVSLDSTEIPELENLPVFHEIDYNVVYAMGEQSCNSCELGICEVVYFSLEASSVKIQNGETNQKLLQIEFIIVDDAVFATVNSIKTKISTELFDGIDLSSLLGGAEEVAQESGAVVKAISDDISSLADLVSIVDTIFDIIDGVSVVDTKITLNLNILGQAYLTVSMDTENLLPAFGGVEIDESEFKPIVIEGVANADVKLKILFSINKNTDIYLRFELDLYSREIKINADADLYNLKITYLNSQLIIALNKTTLATIDMDLEGKIGLRPEIGVESGESPIDTEKLLDNLKVDTLLEELLALFEIPQFNTENGIDVKFENNNHTVIKSLSVVVAYNTEGFRLQKLELKGNIYLLLNLTKVGTGLESITIKSVLLNSIG